MTYAFVVDCLLVTTFFTAGEALLVTTQQKLWMPMQLMTVVVLAWTSEALADIGGDNDVEYNHNVIDSNGNLDLILILETIYWYEIISLIIVMKQVDNNFCCEVCRNKEIGGQVFSYVIPNNAIWKQAIFVLPLQQRPYQN